MKKILFTSMTLVLLSSCGIIYDKTTTEKSTKIDKVNKANNTSIYQKYNRENTKKASDLTSSLSNSGSANSYDAAYNSANIERKKVNKLGFEWNTIGELFKEAKKMNDSGDSAGAIKKLNTAKRHAIIGQRQAIDQKGAGPIF